MRERAGLPGPRAGHDQDGALGLEDGLALDVVQTVEEGDASTLTDRC